MVKSSGNVLRRSIAAPGARIANNFPHLYPTEDWQAHYWTVTEEGRLRAGRAIVQLPQGYASVCLEVEVGYNGCIYGVRRWGVACYTSILEDIGFDPAPLLSGDRQKYPAGDEQEMLAVMIDVTYFDLPGYFIIASQEHPFLLFDPEGILKGAYVKWYTYLGALAYLVSDGAVQARFAHLWRENMSLYEEALGYLLEALPAGDG